MAIMIRQLTDQAAHILVAIAIILPVALWPGVLSTSYVGLCLGLIREVSQHGKLLFSFGSMLDIVFWIMGGLIVGIVAF